MLKDKVMRLLTEASFEVLDNLFNLNYPSVKTFRELLRKNDIVWDFEDSCVGDKDMNSDSWVVYSFTDGMQVVFIKFEGSSYLDGHSTFDQFYEVQPVEKTIIVYEKK